MDTSTDEWATNYFNQLREKFGLEENTWEKRQKYKDYFIDKKMKLIVEKKNLDGTISREYKYITI